MVEIKFTGSSTENLYRQIVAYVERMQLKEAPKRGKHEKAENKKESSSCSCDGDMGAW